MKLHYEGVELCPRQTGAAARGLDTRIRRSESYGRALRRRQYDRRRARRAAPRFIRSLRRRKLDSRSAPETYRIARRRSIAPSGRLT